MATKFVPHVLVEGGSFIIEKMKMHWAGEKGLDRVEFVSRHPIALHKEITVALLPFRTEMGIPYWYQMHNGINQGYVENYVNVTSPTYSADEFIGYVVANEQVVKNYIYPILFTIHTARNVSTSTHDHLVYRDNGNPQIEIRERRTSAGSYFVDVRIGTTTQSVSTSSNRVLSFVFEKTSTGGTQVKVYDLFALKGTLTFTENIFTGNAVNAIITDGGFNLAHRFFILTEGDLSLLFPQFSNVPLRKFAWVSRRFIVTNVKYDDKINKWRIEALSTSAYVSAIEVNDLFENKTVQDIITHLLSSYVNNRIKPIFRWSQNKTVDKILLTGKLVEALFTLAKVNDGWFYNLNNYFIFEDDQPRNINATLTLSNLIPEESENLYAQQNRVLVYTSNPSTTRTENFTGNGTTTNFTLVYIPDEVEVLVNGVKRELGVDYDVKYNTIIFKTAPANGASITVNYTYTKQQVASARSLTGINEYKLYVTGFTSYSELKQYALKILQSENQQNIRAKGIVDLNYLFYNFAVKYDTQKLKRVPYLYYVVVDNEVYDQISKTNAQIPNIEFVQGHQTRSYDFVKTAVKYTATNTEYAHTLAAPITPVEDWIFNVKLNVKDGSFGRVISFLPHLYIDDSSTGLKVYVWNGTSYTTFDINIVNNWARISVVKSGSKYTIVVDGIVRYTLTASTNVSTNATEVLYGLSTGASTATAIDTVIINRMSLGYAYFHSDSYTTKITHNNVYVIKEFIIDYTSAFPTQTVVMHSLEYDALQQEKEYYEKIHSLEDAIRSQENVDIVQDPQEIYHVSDIGYIQPTISGTDNVNISDSTETYENLWDVGQWDGSTWS